jgi:hypothetical protein
MTREIEDELLQELGNYLNNVNSSLQDYFINNRKTKKVISLISYNMGSITQIYNNYVEIVSENNNNLKQNKKIGFEE